MENIPSISNAKRSHKTVNYRDLHHGNNIAGIDGSDNEGSELDLSNDSGDDFCEKPIQNHSNRNANSSEFSEDDVRENKSKKQKKADQRALKAQTNRTILMYTHTSQGK